MTRDDCLDYVGQILNQSENVYTRYETLLQTYVQ